MFRFHKKYFILTFILFLTEVLIALYVHDNIIRPYFGDVLVVILIYCFVQTFFDFHVIKLSVGILIFSFLVEVLQYFNFVNLLGLQDSKLANIVIGNSFGWGDLIAYTLGVVIIILVEKKLSRTKVNKGNQVN